MKDLPLIGKSMNMNQGFGSDNAGWETIYNEGKNIGEDDLMSLYTHAYSNVRLIADSATQIKPVFVRRSNPEVEVAEHWLKTALESDKRRSSLSQFLNSVYSYSLVSDNTYIQAHYSTKAKRGFPFMFDVLLPTSVKIKYDKKSKSFDCFNLITGDAKGRDCDDKEIIHIADWSPMNKLGGFSPVKSLAGYLTIEQLIAMYQVGFFQNSAIPSGAFVIEADEADFQNIVEQVKSKHMGAGSNHAIQFIRKSPRKDQMMKFEKYQMDNNSLEMGQLFARIDKKIDEAFGVPKEMRGDLTNSKWSGYRLAERVYYKQVVVPKVEKVFETVNTWVKRNFPGEDIMLTFENPMPEDIDLRKEESDIKKACAETAKILRDAGATEEAIQEITGLEELRFTQLEGTAKSNADVTPFTPTREANKSLPSEASNTGEKLLSVSVLEDFDDKILAPFNQHLESQLKRVLKLYAKKKLEDTDNLDTEEEVNELRALVLPVLLVLLEAASRQQRTSILAQFGIPAVSITAPLMSQSFRQAVTVSADRLFREYTNETRIHLRNIQSEGVRLSWTRQQYIQEFTKYYKEQGPYIQQGGKEVKNNAVYRAKRLTTTETNRANNRAALEQMRTIQQQTGLQFEKIWRRRGDRPEPICDALDGTRLGLTEPFIKQGAIITEVNDKPIVHDYFSADVPPQHPNCQCYVEFVRVR